jgi:ABC-type uncharacterized transport system substrate-binding protein
MRRREFITLIVCSAAWPINVVAQQRLPTVGFLRSSSASDSAELVAAFRQGMKDSGYIENEDVAVEYRWASGRREQLPKLAAELAKLPVAVIVANQVAIAAAKAAASAIPIVFVTGADPVAAGDVPNLNRPGGNVTGVSFYDVPLAAKRVELLHVLVPKAEIIGVLLDSSFPEVQTEMRETEAAGRSLNQKIAIVKVDRGEDLNAAFASIVQSEAAALVVGAGPDFRSRSRDLVELAAKHAIPAVYSHVKAVADGGLLSYAASQKNAYRRAGIYVARILKGEKPGDLPVELPTKLELAINLKTAKSLGIQIPQSLLATADQVIE